MKDIILKLKNELGLTTEDLSLKSNVPVGTINKILNGETPNPRLSTAKALALALGCSLDYLTGEDKSNNGSVRFMTDICREIETACKQLNDDGQNKVLEYALDLLSVDRYKKGHSDCDDMNKVG